MVVRILVSSVSSVELRFVDDGDDDDDDDFLPTTSIPRSMTAVGTRGRGTGLAYVPSHLPPSCPSV